MAEISSRSTKQQILAAYEAQQKKVAALEAAQLNPTKLKQKKAAAQVNERVKGLNLEGVTKSIQTTKSRTAGVLDTIQEELVSQLMQFEDMGEALRLREAELQELYGIERQAESLAALIETQNSLKAQYAEEDAARRESFQNEMDKKRAAWEEEKSEHARQTQILLTREQEDRQREMETWKYNHARDERVRLDKLEDALNAKRKAFNTQMEDEQKQLKLREEEVTRREENHEDLELQVQDLTARLETEVESAREEASKRAKTSFGIEVNALKRGHEADMKVAEGQIATLQADNQRLASQVANLEQNITQAYAKIQETANKALDAQGNRNTVEQVQNALSQLSAKK